MSDEWVQIEEADERALRLAVVATYLLIAFVPPAFFPRSVWAWVWAPFWLAVGVFGFCLTIPPDRDNGPQWERRDG